MELSSVSEKLCELAARRTRTLFNFEGPPSNGGIAQTRQTCEYGGVAQLGEHLPCKQGVDSSILFVSTSGEPKGSRSKQVWPMEATGHGYGLIAQVVRAHA